MDETVRGGHDSLLRFNERKSGAGQLGHGGGKSVDTGGETAPHQYDDDKQRMERRGVFDAIRRLRGSTSGRRSGASNGDGLFYRVSGGAPGGSDGLRGAIASGGADIRHSRQSGGESPRGFGRRDCQLQLLPHQKRRRCYGKEKLYFA